MAARRIGQYVPDWIKIAAKVPAEAKPNFARFRTNYETIKSSLEAIPPKPEPIDWEFYSKNISKPGMVEAFRKAYLLLQRMPSDDNGWKVAGYSEIAHPVLAGYDAVTVPFPNDVDTPNINQKEKELEEHSHRVVKLANANIAEFEAELQKIKSQKPFEEMTVDDYLVLHPEIKKQAEEEISRNDWS